MRKISKRKKERKKRREKMDGRKITDNDAAILDGDFHLVVNKLEHFAPYIMKEMNKRRAPLSCP
jgi:hypothetical protein